MYLHEIAMVNCKINYAKMIKILFLKCLSMKTIFFKSKKLLKNS